MSWHDVQPWWNGLAPVVTLALGYFGTILTEGRRDRRARENLAADRQAARAVEATDRRRDFELASLIEVEESIRAHVQAVSELLGHAAPVRGSEAYEAYLASNRDLRRKGGYVLNNDIRALVEAFRKSALDFVSAREEGSASTSGVDEVVEAAATARDAIQSRVRAIYDEAVTRS